VLSAVLPQSCAAQHESFLLTPRQLLYRERGVAAAGARRALGSCLRGARSDQPFGLTIAKDIIQELLRIQGPDASMDCGRALFGNRAVKHEEQRRGASTARSMIKRIREVQGWQNLLEGPEAGPLRSVFPGAHTRPEGMEDGQTARKATRPVYMGIRWVYSQEGDTQDMHSHSNRISCFNLPTRYVCVQDRRLRRFRFTNKVISFRKMGLQWDHTKKRKGLPREHRKEMG
jgi:hypothetical protein